MPDITFTISTEARDLLKQVAFDAWFKNLAQTEGNIKKMTRAYWEAGIRALKQKEIEAAKPQPNMTGVDLGAD
jgi:hypothetical protein